MLMVSVAAAVVRVEAYEDISFTPHYAGRVQKSTPVPGGLTPVADEVPVTARFRLTAQRILATTSWVELSSGDSFYIVEEGGYRWGKAYEHETTPLLKIGSTYLLFLFDGPAKDAFWAMGVGRFEVLQGVLEAETKHFRNLGLVREFDGLPLDEAERRVVDVASYVPVGFYRDAPRD